MSTGADFFHGPFSFDLDLRVVGDAIHMAWTEWTYGGAMVRKTRVIGDEVPAPAPESPGPLPPFTVPGHDVWRMVTAVDGAGTVHLAAVVERLVELEIGDANWHSRIVTATLEDGAWVVTGESCIDYAMNPWMAGYAGRRRRPSLAVDPAGGAWVFFEEKLDPKSMSPGPGRLIVRRVDDTAEYVLLAGHQNYHVAEQLLRDGRVVVASLTQHDRYAAVPPAYELHCVDPRAPLESRPADLPNNAAAPDLRISVANPEPRPRDGDRQLFFGDPHLHSELSGDLEGEQEELYPFARDVAKIDFVAFTENDYAGFTHPLTPAARERTHANAERFNEPGIFTALHGWEFTLHQAPMRPAALNSHRCVLFPGSEAPLLSWLDIEDAPELARRLHGTRALLHHHHPSGYDITDDTVESNIEVCSGWWNCMHIPQFVERLHALLNAGHHLGFIGGSDNHERNPGLGGALTGVWATANTRAAIFAALAERRCFATTGCRPDLRFSVDAIPMGGAGPVSGPPTVRVAVRGADPVAAIRIVRDGEVVHQAPAVTDIEWRDDAGADAPHWYYAHVQFVGDVPDVFWNRAPVHGVDAWTSPVRTRPTTGGNR